MDLPLKMLTEPLQNALADREFALSLLTDTMPGNLSSIWRDTDAIPAREIEIAIFKKSVGDSDLPQFIRDFKKQYGITLAKCCLTCSAIHL